MISPQPLRALHRLLEDKAEYVRHRGFELLQQELIVHQYVEKHGRITRNETAGLCQISGPQAYRLLDRLSRQGLITREGARGRGVAYTRDKA
jgi:ATP-dependent DNA helicase RecG